MKHKRTEVHVFRYQPQREQPLNGQGVTREQHKTLNRGTCLSLITLPLCFCQCRDQGQMRCWEKIKLVTGAKKLSHRIRPKSILFPFLAVAITISKKRNRTRYMCIPGSLSLHYHLPSPLRVRPATFWAASQAQTVVVDHHSGICLLSISLAHLQRYLLSVLTTTVRMYHMLIISFCLGLQSVPVSVVWL